MRHRAPLLGAIVAIGVAFAAPAFAQSRSSQAAAREAYDRAVSLHARKDFTGAARQFALADQLVPSDTVLADAIDASVAADDAVYGSMLAARAARRPSNAELQRASNRAREKFRGRAGRIELRCPGPSSSASAHACDAEIDGKSADPAYDGWLTTGPHVIALTTATHPGYRDEHRIDVAAGETVLVTFQPPRRDDASAASTKAPAALAEERKPVDEPSNHHGIAPTWFWVGAGVTAVVAGGAVLSWVDASKSHRDFVDRGCAGQGSNDCVSLADDGKSALVRTNVLIGVASATAVATAAIGIFLVDWKGRGENAPGGVRASVSVVPGPGGARAVLSGRF